MSTSMNATQDWIAAAQEIMELMASNIPEIKFIDLWAEQVFTPEDEYPFPTPAAFLEFNVNNIDDVGENVQDLNTHITVYLLYLPTGDTHQGSTGNGDLELFGGLLRDIYRLFQGQGGENFSQAIRISLKREKAAPYEWVYSQTFSCLIRDYGAVKEFIDQEIGDATSIVKGRIPSIALDNMYDPG